MSIAKGLAWAYIERWGSKVIALIVFILLARLLEPRDFGMVVFAKLFIDYFDMIAGQGLGLALIQRENITNTHINTAFWIILSSGILLSALLYIFSPHIESIFSEPGVAVVLRALTILLVINALSRVQVALLTREQRFKGLALRGLVMSLVGGVVGVSLAVYGYGVWSLVFQHIVGACVALLILWGSVNWRPSAIFDIQSARDLYSFASKIFAEKQVMFLSTRLDEILISAILGTTLLGYYSVGKRLFMTLADLLYSVMAKVLLANFSRLQGDQPAMMCKANQITRFIAVFAFPLFMAGTVASNEIILFLFGDKWAQSAVPFAILMVSGLFLLTPNVLHIVFYAIDRPGIALKLNIFRAILSVLFISYGSNYGLPGIAFAILFVAIAGALLDFIYLERIVGIVANVNWRIQLKHAMYCLPMVAIIILIGSFMQGSGNVIPKLIYYLASGIVVYVCTLILLKAQVLQDGLSYFRKTNRQ